MTTPNGRRRARPAGAGTTCCRSSSKLESDQDFAGGMHGTDGPVPVWRLARDKWPPISKVLEGFAEERQFPFVADMNGDFRDGYAVVPISNWPGKRASAAICYLTADVRARGNLTIISGATVTDVAFDGRRATGVTRQRRRRNQDLHRPRDHSFARRHPFIGDADALRHRPGRRICASTASRCAPICPVSAPTCPIIRCCSSDFT